MWNLWCCVKNKDSCCHERRNVQRKIEGDSERKRKQYREKKKARGKNKKGERERYIVR